MKTISTEELQSCLRKGDCTLVDVRSASEFGSGHVPGAVNIPMDQVNSRLGDLGSAKLFLICLSGQRAALVARQLEAIQREAYVVEGGTKAWERAGHPLVRCVKASWSLERQVRLGAGMMILSGLALSVWVGPIWLLLTAFVGAGLTFAGLTDICPMGVLLTKMPWNAACKPTPVRQITDAPGGLV